MEMQPTIDEVYEAVRESRHRGPDALAALALRYGADAVGWMIRHAALRRELLDAERGMDEARDERDAAREAHRTRAEARAERDAALARPTYEARTTPPTLAEREAHQAAGGAWLVSRIDSDGKLHSDLLVGWYGGCWEGCIFVALDAERRPCAWPVPAVEVTP